jgi:hypothetical protein
VCARCFGRDFGPCSFRSLAGVAPVSAQVSGHSRPYYGDLGSDLQDFEVSMRRCREIDARWYGTSHQKGVIEGATEFRRRLDTYAGVVEKRDATLLKFLAAPRTVEEIVEHRLVYRPHVEGPHVRPVEHRTAVQHLDRLRSEGRVAEVENGRFRAA